MSEALQVELIHTPYVLSRLGGEKMELFNLEEQADPEVKLKLNLNLDQMEDL